MHVHCIILIGSVILDVYYSFSNNSSMWAYTRERERERRDREREREEGSYLLSPLLIISTVYFIHLSFCCQSYKSYKFAPSKQRQKCLLTKYNAPKPLSCLEQVWHILFPNISLKKVEIGWKQDFFFFYLWLKENISHILLSYTFYSNILY